MSNTEEYWAEVEDAICRMKGGEYIDTTEVTRPLRLYIDARIEERVEEMLLRKEDPSQEPT